VPPRLLLSQKSQGCLTTIPSNFLSTASLSRCRQTERSYTTTDGLLMRIILRPKELYACCKSFNETRNILLSHGYGSYVGKFAYYAKLYHDQGYDVVGMDYKGFGHSEGVRGRIESRADFYEDGF
jgi:alpha-beta hydrolase superfamily lysophospholipase